MTDCIGCYSIHPAQKLYSQRQRHLLEFVHAIAGQTAMVHQVGRLPRDPTGSI